MDQVNTSAIDAVPPRHSWGIDPTELLAVIAIIMVLITLAMRYYNQALVKAAASEALQATQLLRRESSEFHDRTGRWPRIDELSAFGRMGGGAGSAAELGTFVTTLELDADGAMTVTYGPRMAQLAGHRLTLHPVFVPGSDGSVKRWSCGPRPPPPPAVALGRDRTDVPEPYLLHVCRQGVLP